MRIWIITNINAKPGPGYEKGDASDHRLEASAIQNFQTAMALADLGHDVLLWVAGLQGNSVEFLEHFFGRSLPEKLRLLPFRPKGAPGEKRTPFSSVRARLVNTFRARLKAFPPDGVLTRSPLAIWQMKRSVLIPRRTRLALEFQYPEWSLLWRGWRKKHPRESLGSCVGKLRELRGKEDKWLAEADGVLCAAAGHEPLLRRINYTKPARPLPSGCLPPEDEASRPEPEFDFGYVGGLAPDNGPHVLLEALPRLPGTTLRIVGAGGEAYERRLKDMTEKLGLADRVRFTGQADFRDIRRMMQNCRMGVAPFSARYGPEKRQWASPLKLVEWMGAGVPLVAASVPSVRRHTSHGREALLFRPDDPADLARTLETLSTDSALRETLKRGGLEKARQSSFPQRAQRIVDFFRELS